MVHEIRDEENALCVQIKTACIPEYNYGGGGAFPDVLERDFQDIQLLQSTF